MQYRTKAKETAGKESPVGSFREETGLKHGQLMQNGGMKCKGAIKNVTGKRRGTMRAEEDNWACTSSLFREKREQGSKLS